MTDIKDILGPDIDLSDTIIDDYETMTREQLIECCKGHDAHHDEHHQRQSELLVALQDMVNNFFSKGYGTKKDYEAAVTAIAKATGGAE